MMASENLCDMCKTISITSLAYLGYFTHYRSSVFQIEETRACPLCALIWDALRSDWARPGIENLPVRLLLNPSSLAQGPINHLEVVIASRELFESRLWFPPSWTIPTIPELVIGPPDRYEVPRGQLEISAVLGTPAVHTCKHNIPEVDSGSENCSMLASQWIEACSKYHNCVCPGDVVLPKRVIEVGLGEDGKLSKLFAQSESGIPRRGKYIALSYCWGTKNFLNSTPSNIKEFQKGIPSDLLPQTIRDAIVIVRKLGFQFLWVDALCILQGSSLEARSDWETESIKMAEIYSGAHFTILAASSNGAYEGILRKRTASTTSCRIPYRSSGLKCDGLVEIGRRPRPSILKEPLDERAWTYQEFILSQRVLKYGSTELSWKCCHAEWTESDWKPTQELVFNKTDGGNIPRDWRRIIEQYSPRKLTKATDRLAALAGLKSAFQMRTNDMYAVSLETQANAGLRTLAHLEAISRMRIDDIYLAGLWQNDLPLHLLWYRSSPNVPRDITGNDGQPADVPSWSWISVNDGVKFYRPEDIESTSIVVLANKGAFLPFRKNIQEEGPPVLILKGYVNNISSIRYVAHGQYIMGLQLDFPWSFLPETLHTFLDDAPTFVKRSHQPETPNKLSDVCFFWIGTSSGLILMPCPQKGNRLSVFLSRKEYRRVGMFYGHPVREQNKPIRTSMSTIHLI